MDVPYAAVGPYSKWYVVATPRGSTVPFSSALRLVTVVAATCATKGGVSAAVVNCASAPSVVPSALVATSRKW